MFAKQSTNRSDATRRAEKPMPQEPHPLSNEELEELILLVADRSSRAGRDVLAFTGARSGAGIVAKIMIADAAERRVLLIAIRRALEQARAQV
jgi:hypothetical protein